MNRLWNNWNFLFYTNIERFSYSLPRIPRLSGAQFNLLSFQSVLKQAERARMELERELDDLNERLEEQGGATQAQVKKVALRG